MWPLFLCSFSKLNSNNYKLLLFKLCHRNFGRLKFKYSTRNRYKFENSLDCKCCYSSVKQLSKSHSLSNISYDDERVQRLIRSMEDKYAAAEESVRNSDANSDDVRETVISLKPLISTISELQKYKNELKELDAFIKDLENQNEEEVYKTLLLDKEKCEHEINDIEKEVIDFLVPKDDVDEKDIIIELTAGVGGQEAMLFTKDMFDMYCNYATFKGWKCEVIKYNPTDIGGIRSAHVTVSGQNVNKIFKFESGVHRVQRVPKTERTGRIHTSTATVAVLPQPSEIDIVLKPSDIEMVCKHSTGAGGQNVNKTYSCVRLTHIATGITTECQMERSQHRNREIALQMLKAKLYQRELDSVADEINRCRKSQISSAARSEKIRTYNFVQDRITDHRAHHNVYGIQSFLQGQQELDYMLKFLQNWNNLNRLNEILEQYNS